MRYHFAIYIYIDVPSTLAQGVCVPHSHPAWPLCFCRNISLAVFVLGSYHFVATFTNAQFFFALFIFLNTDFKIDISLQENPKKKKKKIPGSFAFGIPDFYFWHCCAEIVSSLTNSNAYISILISQFVPLCVPTSVLYPCISITAPEMGSSVPFF